MKNKTKKITMKKLTCKRCGQEFEYHRKKKYCGKGCSLLLSKRVKRCMNCGNEFSRSGYKHCSERCQAEFSYKRKRERWVAMGGLTRGPHMKPVRVAGRVEDGVLLYDTFSAGKRDERFTIKFDVSALDNPDIAQQSFYVKKIIRNYGGPTYQVRSSSGLSAAHILLGVDQSKFHVLPKNGDWADMRLDNLRAEHKHTGWTLQDGFIDEIDGIVRCRVRGRDGVSGITMLDAEDYEALKDQVFPAHLKHVEKTDIYAGSLHRVVMGDPKGLVIDHIDGDTLNNTKRNLRACTLQENLHNRQWLHPKNKTGYTGVALMDGKYHVHFCIPGQHRQDFFGAYDTLDEAVRVRKSLEQKYYRDFAPRKEPKKRPSTVNDEN